PGVTLAVSAASHSGSSAAVVSNWGAGSGTCVLNDAPNWVATTVPGTYTGTLWVRADTAGGRLTLKLKEWSGVVAVGEAKAVVALSGDWQPVRVDYTAVRPGASTLDLSAYLSDAPPGGCFEADDASISVHPPAALIPVPPSPAVSPAAGLAVSPDSGAPPLAVTADASGSGTGDGTPI